MANDIVFIHKIQRIDKQDFNENYMDGDGV